MNNLFKYILFTAIFFRIFSAFSQEKKEPLSLEETVAIAREKSLQIFMAKRQYALEYWRFRSFRSRLLPQVSLDMEPFTYNRAFVERYDADLNVDIYRLQQNLNSFARISVNQNILLTGAQIFVSSSFNRLVNFGETTIENYSTVPIRIGLVQPIMAFNELKWQDRTAALELEKAEKEFLADQQEINLRAVELFFSWALASERVAIIQENKENAQRLFEIGQERFNLGSIERDELLNLELENFTFTTSLAKAEQEMEVAISDLKLFLNLQNLSGYAPLLPKMVLQMEIDLDKAMELAKKNNPKLLETLIQEIQAERDLDRVIKENRFDLSVVASYGLNQQSNDLEKAYQQFLDQQIVAINFSMPLLDWGERKGNIQMARMTRDLVEAQIEQAQNEVSRQLLLIVNKFNLQEEQVVAAQRAQVIAKESFEITEKRFLSGQVDLLRLSNARNAWQTAIEQYILSLKKYWEYYYQVQRLTLYNFIQNRPLTQDFVKLLK